MQVEEINNTDSDFTEWESESEKLCKKAVPYGILVAFFTYAIGGSLGQYFTIQDDFLRYWPSNFLPFIPVFIAYFFQVKHNLTGKVVSYLVPIGLFTSVAFNVSMVQKPENYMFIALNNIPVFIACFLIIFWHPFHSFIIVVYAYIINILFFFLFSPNPATSIMPWWIITSPIGFGSIILTYYKYFPVKKDFLYTKNLNRVNEKLHNLNEQLNYSISEISQKNNELEAEKQRSDKLLMNILPKEVADELKNKGYVEPVFFPSATICFTDFQGFTKSAEQYTPRELIAELDECFSYFDALMFRYRLEKLKTIGDAYMFAGGIPVENKTHPIDTVLAGLEIINFLEERKREKMQIGELFWDIRIGLHTGPLVAGVIGENKFAYDVWGDTVNMASRMESSGKPGKVNISRETYELVKDFFVCEYRGKVVAKNKGEIEMFFVNSIRPELSQNSLGMVPGSEFVKLYTKMQE